MGDHDVQDCYDVETEYQSLFTVCLGDVLDPDEDKAVSIDMFEVLELPIGSIKDSIALHALVEGTTEADILKRIANRSLEDTTLTKAQSQLSMFCRAAGLRQNSDGRVYRGIFSVHTTFPMDRDMLESHLSLMSRTELIEFLRSAKIN